MRKNHNTETIEGYLYHMNLTKKTVQNKNSENFGKEFIQGEVSVATDDAGLNVIPVHYSYVVPTTKQGKDNVTYQHLLRLIESGKTYTQYGKDEATKVKLSPSAAVNDFYPKGQTEVVSQQRNEGGFASIINDLDPEGSRNKFAIDALLVGFERVEPDEEKNITEEYGKITAYIFNFKNDIMPFNFVVKSQAGMDYFEGLGFSKSNPVYTQVWGQITNTTIKTSKVVESAFGEPTVDETERHIREWVVSGAKPEPYEIGGEDITVDEINKALQDRQVYLADVLSKSQEFYASKGDAAAPAAAASAIPEGGFKF